MYSHEFVIPISFSENSFLSALFLMQFQCCCVYRLISKCPSTVYLNWSICFNLLQLIKILICGYSDWRQLLRSVFLLFNFNPFFLIFLQQCPIIVLSVLYYFLQLIQRHQPIPNYVPCAFLLWYMYQYLSVLGFTSFSLQREKKSRESTHLVWHYAFFFFNYPLCCCLFP